jgi:hypothetical protein
MCLILHQPVKIRVHGGDEVQSQVALISPLGEWSDSQCLYCGCNKNLNYMWGQALVIGMPWWQIKKSLPLTGIKEASTV